MQFVIYRGCDQASFLILQSPHLCLGLQLEQQQLCDARSHPVPSGVIKKSAVELEIAFYMMPFEGYLL